MELKSKYLSIYLKVKNHQIFANFARNHNKSMKEIFISLVENYIYGNLQIPKNEFIERTLTIRVNEELHKKIKQKLNKKRRINDKKKQRKRTFQNVGENLIDQYILNNFQAYEINSFIKKHKKYKENEYDKNPPRKNQIIKIKLNLDKKLKLQSILENNSLDITEYQKLIEPLLYAYAFKIIDLKDELFERKQLKVKVSPNLYKAFEDKREFQGKNRTIQKVGELIIKQELMKDNRYKSKLSNQ
jgi:hypothetical protein